MKWSWWQTLIRLDTGETVYKTRQRWIMNTRTNVLFSHNSISSVVTEAATACRLKFSHHSSQSQVVMWSNPEQRTHRRRRHTCVSPTGPSSGCGRGTATRRRGCPHYSQSPLWPLWRDGAGSRHPASHRAGRPADRQTDREEGKECFFFFCLF